MLLVLIIMIQAGSLFYKGTTAACAEAVTTADGILHQANQAVDTLQQDFDALRARSNPENEEINYLTLELQVKTLDLISQQNAALLNVLANCR